MPNRTFTFEENLSFLILKLNSEIQQLLSHRLSEFDVTPSQYLIIYLIHSQLAMTPADLSRLIGIDAGAITRLLDRLEAKGLIVRKWGVPDRRSVTIELTDQAKELAPVLRKIAEINEEKFTEGLSPQEKEQLKVKIKRILKIEKQD